MTIDASGMLFTIAHHSVLSATMLDGLAYLEAKENALTEAAMISSLLLHRRLCHSSPSTMQRLVGKGWHKEGEKLPTSFDFTCEDCLVGKHHRSPFPSSTTRAHALLDLIHTDVHDLGILSKGGCRYWVSFIDNFSRYAWVFPIPKKSDVFATFVKWKTQVERETERELKCARDDKGGEYQASDFRRLFEREGIQRQRTATAPPQQHGIAERLNRTIEERVIAMLSHAKLDKSFWGEALNHYMHVHNLLPTAALDDSTPFLLYHKRAPSLSSLRVFGTPAFVHILKAKHWHLDAHAHKCILLGYETGMKAWRFYDPVKRSIVISRHATFIDEEPATPAVDKRSERIHRRNLADETDDRRRTRVTPAATVERANREAPSEHAESDSSDSSSDTDAETLPWRPSPPRRSPRTRRPPTSYHRPLTSTASPSVKFEEEDDEAAAGSGAESSPDPLQLGNAMSAVDAADPKTCREAMSLSDASEWEEAVSKEHQAHLYNCTWDIVNLPPQRKATGSRWVFTKKRRADGTIERYKARIVAQGFTQIQGQDFNELFASVAKWDSMRTLLAIAAHEDCEIHQIDFDTAFLNSPLEETVYLKQPEGVHVGGPQQVCQLRRAIPGLRQASRAWETTLANALTQIGFHKTDSDTSIWTRRQSPDTVSLR